MAGQTGLPEHKSGRLSGQHRTDSAERLNIFFDLSDDFFSGQPVKQRTGINGQLLGARRCNGLVLRALLRRPTR